MLLIIGDKRLSSWSLRPWLILKHFEIPFEEKLIPLDKSNTTEEILKYSPSAKVPALIDGDVKIWESMAIAEYLNEKFPQKLMWPKDSTQRALARAYANEMHGGFTKMRTHMPHDLQKQRTDFDYSPAAADIARVKQIWTDCLKKSKGEFLFGDFSIVDAMFAPVVNRFVTYGIPTDGAVKAYVHTMRELPAHQEWIRAGEKEKF